MNIGYLWLLLMCPDESFRDTPTALRRATRLSAVCPSSSRLKSLQALASLRLGTQNGNLAVAIGQARDALAMQSEGSSMAGFVLAIALQLSSDPGGARAAYDRAAIEMSHHHPGNVLIRQLHAEAAEVLGVSGDAQIEPGAEDAQ